MKLKLVALETELGITRQSHTGPSFSLGGKAGLCRNCAAWDRGWIKGKILVLQMIAPGGGEVAEQIIGRPVAAVFLRTAGTARPIGDYSGGGGEVAEHGGVTGGHLGRGGSVPGGFFVSGGGWTPGGSRARRGGSWNWPRCGRGGPGGWTGGPGGPEGLLLGLLGPVFLEGQLLPEVAGMAAEGRGGKDVLPGYGAIRDPGQEAPVDLGPGGVFADSATFIH